VSHTGQSNSEGEAVMKSIFSRLGLGILLSIILFWVWYSVASNYDYGSLSGTYVFHGNGEICTLYLHPDRTFAQEISRSGAVQKSQGEWHRYGQAHVSFSSEFMRVPGEELNGDGQAHGQFDKTLGLFPVLVLAPLPNGPRFQRKLFH
jgi:hypothetical protein